MQSRLVFLCGLQLCTAGNHLLSPAQKQTFCRCGTNHWQRMHHHLRFCIQRHLSAAQIRTVIWHPPGCNHRHGCSHLPQNHQCHFLCIFLCCPLEPDKSSLRFHFNHAALQTGCPPSSQWKTALKSCHILLRTAPQLRSCFLFGFTIFTLKIQTFRSIVILVYIQKELHSFDTVGL